MNVSCGIEKRARWMHCRGFVALWVWKEQNRYIVVDFCTVGLERELNIFIVIDLLQCGIGRRAK